MRNFVLNLELSFMAETDAMNILESCADIVKSVDYDRDAILIQRLQEQVASSVVEMKQIVVGAQSQRPLIQKIIDEGNHVVLQLEQNKVKAQDSISRLQETFTNLSNTIRSENALLDKELVDAKKMVSDALGRLHDLDEAIRQGQQRIEACMFVKDMATANKTLMSHGKMTLLGKDDLNNWVVKQSWER